MGRTSAIRRVPIAALVCGLGAAWAPPAQGAPVSVGHSAWNWSDPAPQGETLNEVAFQGPRGYAVGEHGTVLRLGASPLDAYVAGNAGAIGATTDGGSERDVLHVPTSPALIGVAFPTAQLGYAADTRGTLFRTGDGGRSWAIEGGAGEPPALGRRRGLKLSRPLSAFPLFAGELADGAIVALGDEAIESTDRGAHWTLIPRPLAHGIGSQPQNAAAGMSFGSVADGYLLSAFNGRDAVMRTADGGRSWAPELLPRPIESIAADYAVGGHAIFTTQTGGLAPVASSLSLALSGPRRLSAAKLRRQQGRVLLRGRLNPAPGGEVVIVSYRTRGRSVWSHRQVTVASDGTFAITVGPIAASTDFVAQWAGDGPAGGAGSAAQSLTVTRR